MKKVPEIRFNGFKGDWTVKLLDDIFRKVTDKNTDNALVETFTNSAQDGIVSQRDFFNHDISNSENIHGYYVVRPDDFVYNPRMSVTAPVGPINRNRLGRAGVMSPLYTVFKAKNSNYNLGFVEYFFKTDKWHSFMWKNGDNGARGDRFSIRDEILKLMPITLPPSNKEQSDISTFFDNLDEYISSQALELQKLKNIKKACLEKMFPKEGELVPEIRFVGFEGNWVIKTLGELFTKVTEKNIDNSLTETFTNSAQEGIISQRDYFNHDISNIENINGYYVVRPDDFVYNPRMSVTAPVGPINRNKLLRSGVMSPLYSVFRAKDERTDLTFLEYFFKTDKWYNFMWKNGDNGARGDRFSIRDEVFQLLPIIIPPSKKEQISIANYFSSLDKFICSTSNKLDKLKQIRKGLLEKMFIANN